MQNDAEKETETHRGGCAMVSARACDATSACEYLTMEIWTGGGPKRERSSQMERREEGKQKIRQNRVAT